VVVYRGDPIGTDPWTPVLTNEPPTSLQGMGLLPETTQEETVVYRLEAEQVD
jgi:hypothetical protein